jgi:ERCC4-type nuclease
MQIKVDSREKELFNYCQETITNFKDLKNVSIISETLPIGDITLYDNNTNTNYIIIERKSLADLSSSIKDGRYEEQSYRLNGQQIHNHNIIYLIEGDISTYNSFKNQTDKQMLYSAMFSISYFKGFSVMRSNNTKESALMICNMAYKIIKGLKNKRFGFYKNTKDFKEDLKKDFKENVKDDFKDDLEDVKEDLEDVKEDFKDDLEDVKEDLEKEYCNVIKKVKKENITENNIGEIMLSQIPGVSATTAITILKHFDSFYHLITNIKENKSCLDNIYTTDINGKQRKLNKTTIANIVKYLTF